jgi:hypothetical protein
VQPWETRRNLKKKPKTRRERENGTWKGTREAKPSASQYSR